MKLKEQMLHRIRATGKSESTFKTYWHWCYQYLLFIKAESGVWRHPSECGRPEVERWLSSLANGREWVSKNTQNHLVESWLSVGYNNSLLLQGLASWVSRFFFHMGKRAGQLYCCARSLTSVRQPARFTRLDWRSGF